MVSYTFACVLLVYIGVLSAARAQLMYPFLLGELGEGLFDFYGSGQGSYLMLNRLNARITQLETNVRSGAYGGCESGVVGPLSAQQSSATIKFRGVFLTPPAISLSLSDITTANASHPVSVQVRPSAVSRLSANVNMTDMGEPSNVASAFIAYMACPSNNSPTLHSSNNSPMLG